MNAISPELDPIEIDSRPCGECGLMIDRHRRVDTPEGPEFFCQDLPLDELTLPELERRAELRRQEEVAAMVEQWELADPRDAWRHTGEAPPPAAIRNSDISGAIASRPAPYRTAQSTIDAFWYVVRLDDIARLRAWLGNHPKDAPYLISILEGRDNA